MKAKITVAGEMKIGEIYLENHLPWASIEPVKLNIWDKELDKKVSVLKEKSAARIKENRLYQTYIRQIEPEEPSLFFSIAQNKGP